MNDDREDRIDLSALDPTAAPKRFDRSVAGIMEQARFELLRRRKLGNMVGQLGRWQRPMAAAAVIALLVTYSVVSSPDPFTDQMTSEFNDYLGLPREVAQWVAAESLPAAEEILFLAEEGAP